MLLAMTFRKRGQEPCGAFSNQAKFSTFGQGHQPSNSTFNLQLFLLLRYLLLRTCRSKKQITCETPGSFH